jgi:multiple sugar transport system permease protein
MQMATRRPIQALRSPTSRRLRLGLLFVSPWIIGFCAFYLYPFFATFYYSFTRFTGIGNPVNLVKL